MPVSLTCVCGAGNLNLGSGQPEILPQIVLVMFFVGYFLFLFLTGTLLLKTEKLYIAVPRYHANIRTQDLPGGRQEV